MSDIDQTSRDRIRTDINSNFFVEAGAGSGKTSVLVDRMLAMVEGGLDISKICAITFTKAAAGEFYARFQKKLAKSGSELAKKALNDIDLCFMGTIDSFCNMVLSEHPMAAGIPSNAVVVTDDEMRALFIREYSRILQGAAGTPELHDKAVRFAGAFYNAPEVFADGMKIMAANKNTHFNYSKPIETTPDEYFGEKRERLIEILTFLSEHEEIVPIDKAKEVRNAYEALIDGINVISDSWNDNLDDVGKKLKDIKGVRVIPEYAPEMDNFGPGWEDYFTPHMTRNKLGWFALNLEDDALMIEAIQNIKFSIAMDFIADCKDLVSDILKAEGKLSFSDYLLYLRDVLKADASGEGKLIRHIYDRHSYFLIDEFQDTNPIQAEIFFYLTAENPVENWRECVPRQGSLFIVGDPKQSIYRFRNADVASFLKVKEMFNDSRIGEVLYLTRNFRSTDNMCAWFNDAFTSLLPEDTENQSKFNEIPTGEKPEYKGTIEGAYRYYIKNARPYEDCDDAITVAKIIKSIINDPDCTIQDVATKEVRRLEYKDFMLITPAKSHMSHIMNVFLAYDIPFKVEGKVLFGECEALRSISYILQAVADPYDEKAKFAATKLSGCKLTEDALREYAKKARDMSPASVFSMILDDERVFARVGTHNAEYVYFALELLRSATSDGTVGSIKEASDFLQTLIDDKSGQERCLQLRSDANRVHIANLHKVKGLQAPIVILADGNRKEFEPDIRVDYKGDTPESYIFNLGKSLKTTDFETERDKEKEVLEGETDRLLYVAATRAANVLIIEDLQSSKDVPMGMWAPFMNFDTKNIFDSVKTYEMPKLAGKKAMDANLLYDKAQAESVLKNKEVSTKAYTIRKPSTITLKGVTSSEDDYEDKAEDEKANKSRTVEQALLLGTMVHKIMELLVSSGNSYDTDELVREVLNEYMADENVFEELLKGVAETITSGGYAQNNGSPQDILAELLSADEVHCELPFCFKENKTTNIWHGVMDVVYLKDGKWHIIDYKTNVDASDLDEHYKEQLESYIKAFKEMTGEDADAMIYHIGV